MYNTRFNFQQRLHITYTVTGLFALSGEGNAYILDSTGVFLYDVNRWNAEFSHRMYSATKSGAFFQIKAFGSSGKH